MISDEYNEAKQIKAWVKEGITDEALQLYIEGLSALYWNKAADLIIKFCSDLKVTPINEKQTDNY